MNNYEKMIVVETLHTLAEEIEFIEYSTDSKLEWILVQLRDIEKKLRNWGDNKPVELK